LEKVNIKDLSRDELVQLLESMGEPGYRANQIWDWLYRKYVYSFADMSNLPRELCALLEKRTFISWLSVGKREESATGDASKYLFLLQDGQAVETVLMRYRSWNTLCLSTQVGCAMACGFCASTLGGKIRNLSPAEMLDQVLFVQAELHRQGDIPVTRVVLMGTGEPLDNYDNVMKFLHTLHDSGGLNISYRRVTISTCGLLPGITALAREEIPVNLAVSLHAPDDELRDQLMPINKRYPLAQLLPACREYVEVTGRRITFEYTLIAGINDSLEHARKLSRLLAGFKCHVNIIPLNPVRERNFMPPEPDVVAGFCGYLKNKGITVTQRRELGQDITAACGQLRRGGKKGKVPGIR
jgi:23S rRNA (adenine2503-C2)-methyltransferase